MCRTPIGVFCLKYDPLRPERGDFWEITIRFSGEIVQSKNLKTLYYVASSLTRCWRRFESLNPRASKAYFQK